MTRAPQPQNLSRPPSRAAALDLVGGSLALDFTNTSSGRGSPRHQEHLRDFETLLQWVEHAHVATPQDCRVMREQAARQPERAAATFARALAVRELIWRIGGALADRREIAQALRDELVEAHARSLAFAEIKSRDEAFIWAWDPSRDLEAAILGPITLSALSLLMEKDLSRTKRCEGKECGWLFFDATKNKSRRWCEMRVCGNRAKVRAARQRKRILETPTGYEQTG
jgi:predicted RNA-binding Zn ribbon-like protein